MMLMETAMQTMRLNACSNLGALMVAFLVSTSSGNDHNNAVQLAFSLASIGKGAMRRLDGVQRGAQRSF
jgi:hypothetical protein